MMPKGDCSDQTWPESWGAAAALLAPPMPTQMPATMRNRRPIVLTTFQLRGWWARVMDKGIAGRTGSSQAAFAVSVNATHPATNPAVNGRRGRNGPEADLASFVAASAAVIC